MYYLNQTNSHISTDHYQFTIQQQHFIYLFIFLSFL